ncbi:adenine-specific DNA-methyltransferase [Candidatus Kryptonium thompsonii]|uniref:site-specific DNA-methyltransferase (adenine-specific) n=1 Tax=Candidatus Kryptonium thompsonii TaxID=1633631 RepID=A0A0P1P0H0_9BACT|nr:site-specific DNA-methyltransferase [Candidatus Kryptonium thompsoni]CUS78306.1 adenine-specific DNA-methyltransferase [Candidatus Kryptonium thompsoni]CUS86141.1 adenine-specific DNA-methyltransferase [Candidatus Kryptonium thompsoni]CUS89452.1 adenine-specific DNA-methyltransferase [Candidatus Kryptonium thompsoni]CUS93890.1 adenine-specific DNA-methyltransferase [Candidatus Kryptonium thompsoni]CUT01981.1 adenine-specific DNA-methyltransferase [Candidatus Kryptonium thompsoni]
MEPIQKFQDLLKKLFQFEASDLDFGIYRILNYKRDKIEEFINEDLRNKVESAFAKHKEKILTNINEKYEEIKEKVVQSLGQNAFTPTGDLKEEFKNTPIGREFFSVKEQKEEAEKIDEIKLQVFNDLYNFFSRYYEEGDFVPQYRYSIKGHKYAIPYNGEEIKLYWANSEQYYIKTGLLFRDYTFKNSEYKVIFRTVEAREELGSNKATKERFFVLDDEVPVELGGKTLIVRFQYRELTNEEVKNYGVEGGSNISKQEKINEKSYENILGKIDDVRLKGLLMELKNEKPILLYQLNRFTAKNTKDYFIHKNLKKFLSEQLDYFIKAEVLDIETLEKERFLDKHITRAKVVREIGEEIIDFLSQIEDFQKRLWEKKKFVIETNYVITLDRMGSVELIERLLNHSNFGKQVEEWKALGLVDDDFDKWKVLENKLSGKELSKRYQFLPIDTKYFKDLELEILELFEDIDEALDGLLIKSENWQALNLLLNKYKEKVQTIYIDPPYNTGNDGFLYRDRFQHSSWLTMMENRLKLAKEFLRDDGVIFVSIDDNEINNLKSLMEDIFLPDNFIVNIVWKSRDSVSNDAIVSQNHNYNLTFAKNLTTIRKRIGLNNFRLPPSERGFSNPDNDPRGPWKSVHIEISGVHISEGLIYEIEDPYGNKYYPKEGACWRFAKDTFLKYVKEGRIIFDPKGRQKPRYKLYLNEILTTPTSWWDDCATTTEGTILVKSLFGKKVYTNPKPIELIIKMLKLSSAANSIILDFFAGSGTTAHAVMKLNKEDGGKRKFILVEMADYFETIIIPRLKKVAYSFNWKDGKTQDTDGISQFFKYQILEQYEDTLDNIELKENQKMLELFKDQYLLKYFLDYETRESPYLLNIEELKNPFEYKLKVNLSEVGEPKEMVIDIPETFNYLLGLKVKKIKARKDASRKYLFILGEKEGKNYAIVWREYKDNWEDEDFKKDKEFIIKELSEWNAQVVYVNGQSVLTPNFGKHQVEIRYIELEFKKLMEKNYE